MCSIFNTKNALISLAMDKRIYVIDGTGVFQVHGSRGSSNSTALLTI